jgi:hypothetical protein
MTTVSLVHTVRFAAEPSAGTERPPLLLHGVGIIERSIVPRFRFRRPLR